MPKPYTWNEIKNFLEIELKKTKHIMTFGTIGSCDIAHDIDIIITKKPFSKSSDFYKEVHAIYGSLNEYLNIKCGAKAVRFYNLADENFLKILGVVKNEDLLVHTMIYSSLPQIEIDWAGTHGSNIKKTLSSSYTCLLGEPKDIFSKKFMKKGKYDGAYNFVYHSDRTNSNLEEEKLVKFMNGLFDYIFRKILLKKPEFGKDKEEIREIFYKICDLLDEMSKK